MDNPYKILSKVNPQREDGHRRINSDVFAALIRAKLSGAGYQVVLFILDR